MPRPGLSAVAGGEEAFWGGGPAHILAHETDAAPALRMHAERVLVPPRPGKPHPPPHAVVRLQEVPPSRVRATPKGAHIQAVVASTRGLRAMCVGYAIRDPGT